MAEVTPLREIEAPRTCCGKPMSKTTVGQSVRDMREVHFCRKCGNQERGALIVPSTKEQVK